jgi:hypothetical protein
VKNPVQSESVVMSEREIRFYGLLAEFEHPDDLLAAARKAWEAGYREMDAFSPIPVDGLAEAIGQRFNYLPLIVLGGALLGLAGGYGLQYYAAVIDYPLNVGGRPPHSWPAFIPVTIQLGILVASLAAILGVFLVSRLPGYYHPVFNAPGFEMATRTHFYLAIEAEDPQFDLQRTRWFLESLGPNEVTQVEY